MIIMFRTAHRFGLPEDDPPAEVAQTQPPARRLWTRRHKLQVVGVSVVYVPLLLIGLASAERKPSPQAPKVASATRMSETAKRDIVALIAEARTFTTAGDAQVRWGRQGSIECGPFFCGYAFRRPLGKAVAHVHIAYLLHATSVRKPGLVSISFALCDEDARLWSETAIREWLGAPLRVDKVPPYGGSIWQYLRIMPNDHLVWTDAAGLHVDSVTFSVPPLGPKVCTTVDFDE
jgi:hypothetical protein